MVAPHTQRFRRHTITCTASEVLVQHPHLLTNPPPQDAKTPSKSPKKKQATSVTNVTDTPTDTPKSTGQTPPDTAAAPEPQADQPAPAATAMQTPPPSVNPAPSADSDVPDVAELKAQLLDSMFGIERGLSASAELRGEINELVTQLEALNPTPSPNEALEKLQGEWKLVYTSNSELIALLALSRLPLVRVGDITQTVDAVTCNVTNKV